MTDANFGLDFGTSNSSLAAYDGSRVRLLPLDPYAAEPRVARSLLYVTRDGGATVGQQALDTYLDQNTGRSVELEPAWLGPITMTFAEIGSITTEAYALVDGNAPGRLFQSLKRFLPRTSFRQTNVFGRHHTLEELLARLLRRMLGAVEHRLGHRIERLTVGRPVHFSTDVAEDDAARRRLTDACREAGLADVRFLEEPVAAALAYRRQAGPAPGIGLVFDFGGGTLDVTVVRLGAGADVLATGGVPIGGDLIDSRVVESRLLRRFGSDARFLPDGLPMPRHIFQRLLSWQTMITLNHPQILAVIERGRRDSDRPRQLTDLHTLVTRNYGLALFQAVEEAKIRLSSEEEAAIELGLGDSELREPLSRPDFEQVIGPLVREARSCLLDTVEDAAVAPEEVTVVITTGGSSLIPAFRRMLSDSFPRASLAATDTFTSVAAGLALAGGTP